MRAANQRLLSRSQITLDPGEAEGMGAADELGIDEHVGACRRIASDERGEGVLVAMGVLAIEMKGRRSLASTVTGSRLTPKLRVESVVVAMIEEVEQ